jgi:hypothetical protein
MKILKRRDKLGKTITVRVPEAIKTELDQLRERAEAAGFDVGATLRESLVAMIRQIGAELDALERHHVSQPVDALRNGLDHNLTTSGKVEAA